MHQVNSSRQPFIKRGTRSNATARRLIASTSIAPHVLASTYSVDLAGREVRGATATETIQIGKLTINPGEHFFWVASRFEGRAYLVTEDGRCSATDERTSAMCVAKVQAKQAA